MTDVDPKLEPRFLAGIALLERTGMRGFQLRWHDDEEPTVWLALAQYYVDKAGMPQPTMTKQTRVGHRVGSGFSPVAAVMNLCERVIDGGVCAHCKKPVMFLPDLDDNPSPLDPVFCLYEWDPELEVFRRGCEGE